MDNRSSGNAELKNRTYRKIRLWLGLTILCLIGILALLPTNPTKTPNHGSNSPGITEPVSANAFQVTFPVSPRTPLQNQTRSEKPNAEKLVMEKRKLLVRHRFELANRILAKKGLTMPEEYRRYFSLAEAGDWEAQKALFNSLKERRQNEASDPASNAAWATLFDTHGACEVASEWPAAALVDYGNAILETLPTGAIYFGGSDPGRWIPTLLNETEEGPKHILLTQNALADVSYLEYASDLYEGRFSGISRSDSEKAFQSYIKGVTERFDHDQQSPEGTPKLLRPGEQVQKQDGRISISGQVAVMAINDELVQSLKDHNPGAPLFMEVSSELEKSMNGAVPRGPLLELKTDAATQPMSIEQAQATVQYWRDVGSRLGTATDGELDYRSTYAKMAAEQARILGKGGFTAAAEEAFQVANLLSPGNAESTFYYIEQLVAQKRFDDAVRIAEQAVLAKPQETYFKSLRDQLRALKK